MRKYIGYRTITAARREADTVEALRNGATTIAAVAALSHQTETSAARYLRILEAQGTVSSRLETLAEARARIDALPRHAFVSRRARRVLRYEIMGATERAA